MTKSAKKKNSPPKPGPGIMLDIAGLTLIALSLIGLASIFTSNTGSVGTVGLLIKKV